MKLQMNGGNNICTSQLQSAYLVQTSSEIDDDFPGSVVVDDLKLTNVTCSRKDSVSVSHMKTWRCTHLHLADAFLPKRLTKSKYVRRKKQYICR